MRGTYGFHSWRSGNPEVKSGGPVSVMGPGRSLKRRALAVFTLVLSVGEGKQPR